MCKMLLKGRVSWDVRPLLFLTNNSIRASYEQANMASWNCSFSQSFLRAIGGDWHINRLTHFKYIDNLKRTGLLFSMHYAIVYLRTECMQWCNSLKAPRLWVYTLHCIFINIIKLNFTRCKKFLFYLYLYVRAKYILLGIFTNQDLPRAVSWAMWSSRSKDLIPVL